MVSIILLTKILDNKKAQKCFIKLKLANINKILKHITFLEVFSHDTFCFPIKTSNFYSKLKVKYIKQSQHLHVRLTIKSLIV